MIAAVALVLGCSSPEDENNGHHDHDHDHGHNHEHEHDGGANHHHGDMGHQHGDGGHGEVDLAGIDFGDVVITPAAEDYCECMLITCHDPFHETYGADDAEAIAACQAEASSWPVAGSEQMTGDSIECRQFHCENATGSSNCENALGAACQ